MNTQNSKLFRFKLGVVVCDLNGQYGHVIGFTENTVGEVIVKVIMQDGTERERHPSRLLLEDQ